MNEVWLLLLLTVLAAKLNQDGPVRITVESDDWDVSDWTGIISAIAAVLAIILGIMQTVSARKARQDATSAREDAETARDEARKLTAVAVRTEGRELDDRLRAMRSEVKKVTSSSKESIDGPLILEFHNGSQTQDFFELSLKDYIINGRPNWRWEFAEDSERTHHTIHPGSRAYPFRIFVMDETGKKQRTSQENHSWVVHLTDQVGRRWVHQLGHDPELLPESDQPR